MSYSLFGRGKYWATPPTLTDQQVSPFALDVNSNVRTNVVASALPTGAAKDGTDQTGVAAPTGAVGIRGWLSAIYNVLNNGSLAVTGTFWQATQPVSGTFWQATQPVSGTVTANAGTNLNTSALAVETGGNLAAAKADLDTLAGTVAGGKIKTTPDLPPNAAIETGGNLATIATAQGAGGTGIVQPTGGSGILGWLSGIYDRLSKVVLAAGSAIIGQVGIDQTTPGTTNKVSLGTDVLTENVSQWGGTAVQAAITSADVATGAMPQVRGIIRKYGTVLTTSNLTGSAGPYYIGPNGVSTVSATAGYWDTNQSGANWVYVHTFSNAALNTVTNGLSINGTDDTSNTNTVTLLAGSGANAVGSNYILGALLTTRYYQIKISNGTTTTTTFECTSCELAAVPQTQVYNTIAGNMIVSAVVGSNANGGFVESSGTQASYLANTVNTTGTVSVPVALVGYQTAGNGGSGGTTPVTGARTPSIFKTAQATASGNTAVWTPTSGKKFRLMRFKVQVTGNATLGGAAVLTIGLQDATTDIGVTHDVYVPAVGGATMGLDYDSGWIDLGNGKLSAAANNVLNVNLSAAVTAGNVRVICCGTEE